MIKILAVGNSFSQDATALIELLSGDIHVRNLYVGGCSLERHCRMINDGELYEYQHCGEKCTTGGINLKEALSSEKWDFVTVQQVSGLSGVKESYYPYIKELISYIRKFTGAEIVLHRTWAYETGSDHPDFSVYGRDRRVMWERIRSVTDEVAANENLRVVPSGDLIARLRENSCFSCEKGGLSLCRDGFHLSLNYGRFAAACAWIGFFTGKIPPFLSRDDLSEGYRVIKENLTV
ncbi:MAG: DUF4886 domain-containing protein [Clostridia bacterium]|nr:DUF4886 domain-containing protein [Clostridia bacterium]